METSWMILSFTGVIVLIMMIFLITRNLKDKKKYEEDLNRPSHTYEEGSEVHDVE